MALLADRFHGYIESTQARTCEISTMIPEATASGLKKGSAMDVTIKMKRKQRGDFVPFQEVLLLVVWKKKEASIAEIRDAMITVLKRPVDSAPVYLGIKRLVDPEKKLDPSERLLKEVGTVKEGQRRRVALTPAGVEAAKSALEVFSSVTKAFS